MPLVSQIDPRATRRPAQPVLDLFVRRWSPRAMSGEPVTEAELWTLFEAARWAPSSNNEQPWRFLYARRETEHWPRFFDLLAPGNQVWCVRAAVLLVMVSKRTFTRNGQSNAVHGFDAGSAWMSLALQGAALGLVVHGMAGFDRARARADLGVPEDFEVHAMAGIGRPGPVEDLPANLQEREKPSDRRPAAEIVMEGRFRE